MGTRQWPVVSLIGGAQSLSWASTYYLPAVLGHQIAADVGIPPTAFYAIVSAALVISALMGPLVGRTIDRFGGRWVLVSSTPPCTIGLLLLAFSDDPFSLVIAWCFIAIGMGLGLYEAAAATLASLFGANARRAIANVTLAAGFSSSIGWLATTWSVEQFGWRMTCLHWATIQYTVITPLYLLLPRAPPQKQSDRQQAIPHGNRLTIALALAFCATSLVISGLAAHLPRLLEKSGADKGDAVALAALVGPAQVVARLTEVVALSKIAPVILAGSAAILHPIGATLVLLGVPFGVVLFPFFHGGAAAILTTARATVPLALFGPHAFGHRFGRLSMAIRLVSACGPLLFAGLLEAHGSQVLFFSAGLCLASVMMLTVVHGITQRQQPPSGPLAR